MTQPRTVLVTGAAGGVGSALVRTLTSAGWHVYAAVHRATDVDAFFGQGRVTPLVLDVTDTASIAAAAKEVGPRLDGLVNNAGIIVQGPLALVPEAALRRQYDVNVLGPALLTQALLPALRAARGAVVNVGAVSSLMPVPFAAPIASSKAALASLTGAMRGEFGPLGVRVALVEPGAMRTEIFAKAAVNQTADGYAGGEEMRRTYAPVWAAVQERLDAQKPAPVDATVKAIVAALTARKPRTRRVVGRDARVMSQLRRLPDRTRDKVIMRALGVTARRYGEKSG
jgi:NAD(P)-dependent dehydrogenase (short-subunit alcohol dehydrogenase family)